MLLTTRAFGNISRVALVAIALLSWTTMEVKAQATSPSNPVARNPAATPRRSAPRKNTHKTQRPSAQVQSGEVQSGPAQRTPAAPKMPRFPAQLVSGNRHSARTFVPAHQRVTDTSVRILE